MMNKEFFKAAGMRAIRTFAQSAVSMIAVGAGFAEVDWVKVVSVASIPIPFPPIVYIYLSAPACQRLRTNSRI